MIDLYESHGSIPRLRSIFLSATKKPIDGVDSLLG